MILLQSKITRNPVKASQFRLAYLTVTITVFLHILSHGHLQKQECGTRIPALPLGETVAKGGQRKKMK